jgi:protein TonB
LAEDDGPLRLDERLRAKEELYTSLLAPRGGGILPLALVLGALACAGVLLPGAAVGGPGGSGRPVPPRVVRFVLPPPPARAPVEPPPPEPSSPPPSIAGILPATDPIQEPFVPLDPNEAPPEAEILAGEPEPFVPAAPVAPASEATAPTLIAESRVEPTYPEMARRRSLDGALVLRILVLADGSVGEVSVLRSSRRNVGFEAAASGAIHKWRYHPAVRDGSPVDAYIYVNVRFSPKK